MVTKRQERFIQALPKAKTAKDAAIQAGYAPNSAKQTAWKLKHDLDVQSRISELVDTGLDALERVATTGRNEIAVATAAKTLVETGLGKPKDNKQSMIGDVTINISKIDNESLLKLTATTVKSTHNQPLSN